MNIDIEGLRGAMPEPFPLKAESRPLFVLQVLALQDADAFHWFGERPWQKKDPAKSYPSLPASPQLG